MATVVNAAARLTAYSVPMSRRPELVKDMMKAVGCDEDTAKWYLENEEWIIGDAIDWYKADKAKGKTHK